MNFKKNKIVFSFLILTASALEAKNGVTVSSSDSANNPLSVLSTTGATQRNSQNSYSIRLRASCFGTNLRSVANPVSPNSIITMQGQIKTTESGPFQDFSIRFPASAVMNETINTVQIAPADLGGALQGAKAGISSNLLTVNLNLASKSSVDPVTATITEARSVFQINNLNFSQTNTNNDGEYMAKDGSLSVGSLSLTQSGDGKTYDIETSFPGQNGYCGGYYSPLMVFFDKERPQFNNIVDFDMGHGLKTFWPEKNHAGYFVALPVKNKIKDVNQLFGESKEFNNGFDKLAEFDLNKDGVIDSKDPVYKKLVLWKDTSGEGHYNRKSSILLSKKIKSINLKYRSNIEAIGNYAEYRERSQVTLWVSKTQKQKTADIIDVWFKPVFQNKKENENRLSSK